MKVVKAKTEDLESLKNIAYEWRDSCKAKEYGIELDSEEYFNKLSNLIKRDDSDLLLLMKKNEVVGYMGLIYFQSPLGKQLFTNEHFWYVAGKHRGHGTMKLIRAAKEWAKNKGCSHRIMTASCLASGMHDRLCKFYEKIGFRKFETSFIEEL